MNVFAFILKYLRKTKLMAGVILFALICRSLTDRGEVYAMAQIIGLLPKYTANNDILHNILFYVIMLTFFMFAGSLVNFIWRYTNGKFLPYFCSLIYKDIFVAVHHHSVVFFNEEMAGKIAAKTKNIVSGIKEVEGQIVFGLIRPVAGILVTLFLVFRCDTELGLIIGLLNIIFIVSMVAIRRKIGSWAEKRARFSAETDGVFIDTITNSDLVKSFANYFFEKRRFYQVLKGAVRAEQSERQKDAVFDWQGNLIFRLTYLASCLCIFYFWYLGRLDLTAVVLCTSLMHGLTMDVTNIGFFAGEFAQAYGQVKDGLTLIFSPCQVLDLPNAHNI